MMKKLAAVAIIGLTLAQASFAFAMDTYTNTGMEEKMMMDARMNHKMMMTHTDKMSTAMMKNMSGEMTTTVDLLVRRQPGMGSKKIGFLVKGEKVMVEKSIGRWCKLSGGYKGYKNAYVGCFYLIK